MQGLFPGIVYKVLVISPIFIYSLIANLSEQNHIYSTSNGMAVCVVVTVKAIPENFQKYSFR